MKNKFSILKIFLFFCGGMVMAVSSFIFIFIFIKGNTVINAEFLFSSPKGIPIGTEGGIFPAITGTLYLGILSGLIVFVFSIFTSVYLVFWGKDSVYSKIIKSGIHLLSGFPSVLFGLISYTVLIAEIGMKKSLLTASITVGIMIVPFVTLRFEKILEENSKDLLALISLGVSKSYGIFKMILPCSIRELISALFLGISYGMGAAAPIMYTGAVLWAKTPTSVFDPFMSLPYHLYILLADGISESYAYGTAAVLLCLLLLLDLAGKLILKLGDKE